MGELLNAMDRYGIGLVITGFLIWAGILATLRLFGKKGVLVQVGAKHIEFLQSVKETTETQAKAATKSADAQMVAATSTQAMHSDVQHLKKSHGTLAKTGLALCTFMDNVAEKLELCDETRDSIATIRAEFAHRDRELSSTHPPGSTA